MPFGTILVPLDGSQAAEDALPYAATVAAALHAPIRLFQVVDQEELRLMSNSVPGSTRASPAEEARGPVLQYLDGTAAHLRGKGIEVTAGVAVGAPADAILAEAAETGAGMIVMATRGRGGAARWIIGSVADKVMRTSARPVLLVRSSEPAEAVHLQRIMVPLDGSLMAEAALPLATELATAAGAVLELVRVEPWAAQRFVGLSGAGYVPDLTKIDEEIVANAAAYLKAQKDQLPPAGSVQAHLLRGFPTAALIEFFDQHHMDLVVMTTHARGGLTRLVLGSVADRLVRSGVPTLLVRPTDRDDDTGETAAEG